MGVASRVMYTIANVFTWIIAIFCIAGIVFSSFAIVGFMANEIDLSHLGVGTLVYFIILLIISLITISLVRIAKRKGTSKGWDVLFLILGIIGWNIFYFLGGLFGLIARN